MGSNRVPLCMVLGYAISWHDLVTQGSEVGRVCMMFTAFDLVTQGSEVGRVCMMFTAFVRAGMMRG